MKTCEAPGCDDPLTGKWQKKYCDVSCANRGRAAQRRAEKDPPRDLPVHDHHVVWRGYLHYGTDRSEWGCRECPATWTSPLTVEKLESVACESEAEVAA